MASPSRRSHRDLIRELVADGPRFKFFQAVRLLGLGRADDQEGAIPPELRFRSLLSLAFPPSEITRVEREVARAPGLTETPPPEGEEAVSPDQEDERLSMTVAFMGMTGPAGVLPTAYTELLLERRNQYRDHSAHRFLDIFTHRAVSLFYQAWRKHLFYLPYEAGGPDRFSRNILDIVGVGLRHLQQRLIHEGQGIPDRFLIHYAGLLSQKPISAVNIAAVVSGYFAVPARLDQYIGQWIHFPQEEQTRLGHQANSLGSSAFVGERQWDRQNKTRMELGPLSYPEFLQFMPGERGLAALRELLQFCLGLTTDCDVRLVLRKEEIPPPVIARDQPLRLGLNSWLDAPARSRDVDDVEFVVLSHGAVG